MSRQTESQFEQRVVETVRAHGLLLGRRAVILAVSGGADSMAMLHAMARIPAAAGRLRVAHVHHGLRGRAADADARLVEKSARALALPFHLKRADVRAAAKRGKISIEMAARDARQDFFRELVGKFGGVVATAHTRDDQAETVLLRLVRGSGTDGLGGIAHRAKLRGVTIIRPLLDVGHDEAVAYLNARKLKWREDETNTDAAMLRNRIRHDLLPLLERNYNPRIREVLARTASVLRADSDHLATLAKAELADRLGARRSLDVASPPSAAIWRRVLHRWLLETVRIEPARLENDLVLRVEQLAFDGGALTLPGGVTLRADGERLLISRPAARTRR